MDGLARPLRRDGQRPSQQLSSSSLGRLSVIGRRLVAVTAACRCARTSTCTSKQWWVVGFYRTVCMYLVLILLRPWPPPPARFSLPSLRPGLVSPHCEESTEPSLVGPTRSPPHTKTARKRPSPPAGLSREKPGAGRLHAHMSCTVKAVRYGKVAYVACVAPSAYIHCTYSGRTCTRHTTTRQAVAQAPQQQAVCGFLCLSGRDSQDSPTIHRSMPTRSNRSLPPAVLPEPAA